jgi:hypothetical protein
MGFINDIAGGLDKLFNPSSILGGANMAANDPRSLDYQQMQEAMRQLQATNAQQASPQHLLVPQQLAAQASNVLGTSPAVFGANVGSSGGYTTTTTGTGHRHSTTLAGTGWSGLAQSSTLDDYAFEPPKKKKYANDVERTIDEEVARIKNL